MQFTGSYLAYIALQRNDACLHNTHFLRPECFFPMFGCYDVRMIKHQWHYSTAACSWTTSMHPTSYETNLSIVYHLHVTYIWYRILPALVPFTRDVYTVPYFAGCHAKFNTLSSQLIRLFFPAQFYQPSEHFNDHVYQLECFFL